jgi:preprotein translocase subunit SecG
MLAYMTWPQWFLAALIVVVCCLLIIVVLLQRGRGGGLSGAFGGGGGTAAFGAKTGDVFTWITVTFTAVFVLLAVVANFAFDESARPTTPSETEPPVVTDVPVEEGELPEGLDVQVTPTGEAESDSPIKVIPKPAEETPPPVEEDVADDPGDQG